jgi:hypothetical protein
MNKTGLIYILIFLIAMSGVVATVLRADLDGRNVYNAVNMVNMYAQRFHGLMNRSNIDGHYVNCPVNTYMIGENQTHRLCAGVNASALSVVRSMNGLTGNLNIVAGSNIIVTPSGSSITISSTASGTGSVPLYSIGSTSSGSTFRQDESFDVDNGGWTGQTSHSTSNGGYIVLGDSPEKVVSPNYNAGSAAGLFNYSIYMQFSNISGGSMKFFYASTDGATPSGRHWLLESQSTNETMMVFKHDQTWQERNNIPKNSGPYVFHISVNPSTSETRILPCWNGGSTCHPSGWSTAGTTVTLGDRLIIQGAATSTGGTYNITRVVTTLVPGSGGTTTGSTAGFTNTNNTDFGFSQYATTTRPSPTSKPGLTIYNTDASALQVSNGTAWTGINPSLATNDKLYFGSGCIFHNGTAMIIEATCP